MNKKIITIGAAVILIGTLLTNVSAHIQSNNNFQNEENEICPSVIQKQFAIYGFTDELSILITSIPAFLMQLPLGGKILVNADLTIDSSACYFEDQNDYYIRIRNRNTGEREIVNGPSLVLNIYDFTGLIFYGGTALRDPKGAANIHILIGGASNWKME
jgi:hypothetical protein